MTTALRTNAQPARCEPRDPAPTVPEGMVWIEGGTFPMGSNQHPRAERPAREVRVNGFWIDRACVTNEQFARFVRETGYVTLAERSAQAELAAHWRRPRVPSSSIEPLQDHPVVHVAFEDAMAYASWAGKRLPTEDEWEFAARRGLSFMASEVWQWTVDSYVPHASGEEARYEPGLPNLSTPRKVIRGGFFHGAANDGPAVRRGHPVEASSCHVGFRCVIRYDGPLP